MSKKAVIQGEIHIFPTDRKSLMNRDTDQYEALYCEGRSDTISPHHHRNRYNLYVIGALTLYLLYGMFSYVYSSLPLIQAYDLEAQAKQEGLVFDDNIDLEIHDIFDSYNIQTVNFTLISLIVIFALEFLYSFQVDTISIAIPGLITIPTPVPIWVLTLLIGMLLPFMYFSLLVSYGNTGDRDEKMARTIVQKCDEREHESVLILVGDKHVEPIGEKLDEEGWEVEKERTNNTIARIKRRLGFS